MSTPWRLLGLVFPTDTQISLNADPGMTVRMPMGPMVELQWLVKKLRVTVTAAVRWSGQASPTSPPLSNTSHLVEWTWQDEYTQPPGDKLPGIYSPGNWNDLFEYAASGSYFKEVSSFSVYQQGHPDTPTDDTQIIGYTLTPTLYLGDRVLYRDDNLTDYIIPIMGSFSITPVMEGIDEAGAYNTSEVSVVIGETEFTGSMGRVKVHNISAGEVLQDYVEIDDHAGISVHLMDVNVEISEMHPPPPPIG